MRRSVAAAAARAAAVGNSGPARLVTTPIFYVNGSPHIGHAFSALLADSCARAMALSGDRVRFATGTDEHGSKVAEAASKAAMEPKAYCDGVSASFRQAFDELGVGYDAFVRTTDECHADTVRWLWQRLRARGYVEPGSYEGWYCRSDEAFVTERQTEERDGVRVSIESGHPVEKLVEAGWVFRLTAFRDVLLHVLGEDQDRVFPRNRAQEAAALLRSDEFSDVFLSRPRSRVPWGIAVEPPVHGGPPHTLYVWLDALANYLTVAGGRPALEAAAASASQDDADFAFPGAGGMLPREVARLAEGRGRGIQWGASPGAVEDPARGPWSAFAWPPAVQVVGKDIGRFHLIMWPALLLAAGLALPERIVVHGHFTAGQRKMSKSLGNVVCPTALITGAEPVAVAEGLTWCPPRDALRWYLLRSATLGSDMDFDVEGLRAAWDDELAGAVGNLLTRVTGAAILPDGTMPDPGDGPVVPPVREALDAVEGLVAEAEQAYKTCDAARATGLAISAASLVNAMLADAEPWKRPLGDPERAQVLWAALEGLRMVGIALVPAVPDTATAILDALAAPVDRRGWQFARPGAGGAPPGTELRLATGKDAKGRRSPTILVQRSPRS